MKHTFQIIYANNGTTLKTENRPQWIESNESLTHPSKRMITNALHTICLDNGITQFDGAKATVLLDGVQINEYNLAK